MVAAAADPDESSIVRAPLPAGLHPLLALIVDTSTAAAAPVATREPYVGGRDYSGAIPDDRRCDATRVYWRRGAGPAPDCRLQAGLPPFPSDVTRGFQCGAARISLDARGFYVASRAAQWRPGATGGNWTAPQPFAAGAIECRADGETVIDWDRSPAADPYIFYTGNFLNWLQEPLPSIERPLIEHVAQSLASALRATDELDVAWLRFPATGSQGGYIASVPIPAALAADALAAIAREPPADGAPLAEALVESVIWLSGNTARFGAVDEADDRAFDTLAPGHYQSPITHACRPVELAYLTSGRPAGDEEAGAAAAAALPGFVDDTGGCSGDCLAAVSRWLAQVDLRTDVPGRQSVELRFLSRSPLPEVLAAVTSEAGIGRLDDPLAYINLVAQSLQRDAAMAAAPTLSAPALLAAANPADAADVVFAMSAPQPRERWNGNLFRYALRASSSPLEPPAIVDRSGRSAIGSDALPLPASQSAWSDAPDADLLSGGAAGRLPLAARRAIYAELGDPEIIMPSNRLLAGNPRLQPSMLGLGSGDPESVDDVLDWLTGQSRLGDPGLHAPAIADYTETGRQVVFAATHDGLLHAFDADSGVELWAWMPAALLTRLAELMRNRPTTVRGHGIDGPLVLHRHDPNADGRIDAAAGEHLWLLFGLGRGGNRYYALDVANADAPKLLWSFTLPGETWLESRAEPVVTRIDIDGATQNAGRWVVLLAGGYNRRFDWERPAEADETRALHLVDAQSGNLLWTAGSEPGADLAIGGLDASFATAPRAIDLDGDGRLDRAYAIDVTGGLWRFDFATGRAPADLARAARLAQLGTGPQRFHSTPDVVPMRFTDGVRLAIAVGSGWVARPLDDRIVDRIYAIFDRGTELPAVSVDEADLYDAGAGVDSMPASAPGWFRRIDRHGPGEKIVGPAMTFDHAVRFQTWQPLPIDDALPCGPRRSLRRLYALDVRNGRTHSVAIESPEDDAIEIAGAGLPVALRFGLPSVSSVACPGCRPRAFGIAGSETFDAGYAGDPVRTSWRKLAPPPDSR